MNRNEITSQKETIIDKSYTNKRSNNSAKRSIKGGENKNTKEIASQMTSKNGLTVTMTVIATTKASIMAFVFQKNTATNISHKQ